MKKIVFILALIGMLFILAHAAMAEPIHQAAGDGDIEGVKKCIEKNPKLLNARNPDGRTALHEAAAEGQAEIVEFLLSKKADMNVKDKKGQTALHLAAKDGYIEVISLLIKNKAELNVKDEKGMTPLAIAIKMKNAKTAELLKQAGATE
jgi:ankyrin repeat protein